MAPALFAGDRVHAVLGVFLPIKATYYQGLLTLTPYGEASHPIGRESPIRDVKSNA
jgi:hypothetical protein